MKPEILLLPTDQVRIGDFNQLMKEGYTLKVYHHEGVAMFTRRRKGGYRVCCTVRGG